MRAEVTQEVEEVNGATQAIPPSAQSCSRAGGQHRAGPELVTMRATDEAVEEFLGQIVELGSWNTANGCPVPNMMPGIPSSTSATSDRMTPPAHSNAEAAARKRLRLANASLLKTKSDSGLANSLPLQRPDFEAKTDSLKEKRGNMDLETDIAMRIKSRTRDQGKGQLKGTRIGGEDSFEQEQDQSDCDEENEAVSQHDDDDQNSGSSKREGSSEPGVADYARTMAAAEASYSTFDIPKVMPVKCNGLSICN